MATDLPSTKRPREGDDEADYRAVKRSRSVSQMHDHHKIDWLY